MLIKLRHHRSRKLPILLLVFLLCVQSLGYASHGLMQKAPIMPQVVEQSTPPCHDMADLHDMDMADTSDQDHANTAMPCCDDGNCSDADCMMPAGIHFIARMQIFYVPISRDVFISNTRNIHSITATPPIRPPIA